MARMWLTACALGLIVLAATTSAAVCPTSCICSTTRDGLHRAACSDLAELYKFTLRQKHHNINILDLSHNGITKISHELDRLSEVVTLDLSTNGIKNINKFLHNTKKLVHLNLSHNRIVTLSLSELPASISSLDLTNNLLEDVPSDLRHLNGLEHLELEGNPLNCNCKNIIARDYFIAANVYIDDVKCVSPLRLKGKSWLELKTKDICKVGKPNNINFKELDIMMGDQPMDAIRIGKETGELKSMPLAAQNDLEDGKVIDNVKNKNEEDEDEKLFIKTDNHKHKRHTKEIEGSGDIEVTTTFKNIIAKSDGLLEQKMLESEEMLPVGDNHFENIIEGSGIEGSGDDFIVNNESEIEFTTEYYGTLYTGRVQSYFNNDDMTESSFTTEYPTPKPVAIFMGGRNWIDSKTEAPVIEKITTTHIMRDTTVSEQIRVTQASDNSEQPLANNENTKPHKTGTYVCIAIILILLVGLIGFAIVKGQIRKKRDKRIIRQEKLDVEKASKEMVDMNKSLLGKPASIGEKPLEKKANGKYELVPTHEPFQKAKKGENGDVGNGSAKQPDYNVTTESPRDTNQNKNSSKDNNVDNGSLPVIPSSQQDTSFDSAASPNDSKRDSVSSEEIFVPNEDDTLHLNGLGDLDISLPLINGDPNTNSSLLSPSHDYVPVYSPDMGRVRIKLAETPKPKTPVLVTRSRSNAGDIIVTPSLDGNITKSTT